MNRRRFLSLSCALSTAASRVGGENLFNRAEPSPRVLVVGAGIVGASIGYHLARQAASVTVVEKERPAAGATSKSFAWINATYSKEPRAYYELNLGGMAGWRRLEDEMEGALRVQWGGSVEWYPPGGEADQLRRDLRRHQAWGYAARGIEEAELRALVPGLRPGPVAAAAWSEQEGAVDPVRAVRVLLAAAERQGARLLYPCTITGLDLEGGRLRGVRTTSGTFDCDVLVLAAGTGTPALAGLAGVRVPLKDSPGVLAHSAPLASRLERVVLAPGAHVVHRPDGRVVTGSSFGGTPGTDADLSAGRALLKAAAGFLPFLQDASPEAVTLGWRVLPEDELPIVGFPEGRRDVYVAAMHSGVTLAPLVGRMAAAEILDGISVEALAPFRPGRFA